MRICSERSLPIPDKRDTQSSATSVSRRLSIIVVLTVIATFVSGIPVASGIWLQLEHLVWSRVESAQTATVTLYGEELRRLDFTTALISQNQALSNLLYGVNEEGLAALLADLQEAFDLDLLVSVAEDRQAVGYAPPGLPLPWELLAEHGIPFRTFLSLRDPPRLLMVAGREVLPAQEWDGSLQAWVLTGLTVDQEFMTALTRKTGVEQSLIVGGERAVSSLQGGSTPSFDPSVEALLSEDGSTCCTKATLQGQDYYLGLATLNDSLGQVVALSEVALPANTMRASGIRTILLLFVPGVVTALVGSLLLVLLTRRIIAPLTYLTGAAHRMATGDLATPIEHPSNLQEITDLTTELIHARRHLQLSQQTSQVEKRRIELLLEAIHEGVITLNEDGKVTFFSSDAERILGYQASAVLNKPYTSVLRPAPDAIFSLEEVLEKPEGTLPVQRLAFLDAQDNPITLEISASLLNIAADEGPIRERVLVLRDLSEEEAIRQLHTNFLANISHEFRTPLSAVTATTELLIDEARSMTPEEFIELAYTIRMSTMGLQTLIDNLLESSTIEAGTFQVQFRPTHLEQIIDNAVETMNPLLQRRDQKLEIELPADLPSIWADPDRLAQVLVNLIANASKFGPMGEPIVLSARPVNGSLYVAVMDSGPGLPAGRFSDLFKRFGLADRQRDPKYGIGLGLPIVKAIVEAHGGNVGAENRPEGGAKVWFTLPIDR
ncbi:MAG: PAS domain-containing protein [Anaerolineales bacterium]|nr:PAS domain-containing protein [Anaerolineales bacterium]